MGIWLSEPVWSMVARSARQSVGPLLPSGVGRATLRSGADSVRVAALEMRERIGGCALIACLHTGRRLSGPRPHGGEIGPFGIGSAPLELASESEVQSAATPQ